MTQLIYIDQNAWVALSRGAWDKSEYPSEHQALTKVVRGVQSNAYRVALSFANVYETFKINDPVRRCSMARTQSLISRGYVFRGRRTVLRETLIAHIAERSGIDHPRPDEGWFLSDLWFESADEYTPEIYGFQISDRVLEFIRHDLAWALFDYMAFTENDVRIEGVRRYSQASAELIKGIETRRALVAGQKLPLRKRAYGAKLIIDELDFILQTGRRLGLDWQTVRDIGPSLVRSIVVDVPILRVEKELVVRLEDQSRAINENDLRDMMAFTTALPLADVVVAEKPFVNLARQARLGDAYGTELLTSIFDF